MLLSVVTGIIFGGVTFENLFGPLYRNSEAQTSLLVILLNIN